MRNHIEEIRKLASPSDCHQCPARDNPADLISRRAKVAKIINDPTLLLEPKWLNFPPTFCTRSEDKEVINENELEYKRKGMII